MEPVVTVASVFDHKALSADNYFVAEPACLDTVVSVRMDCLLLAV